MRRSNLKVMITPAYVHIRKTHMHAHTAESFCLFALQDTSASTAKLSGGTSQHFWPRSLEWITCVTESTLETLSVILTQVLMLLPLQRPGTTFLHPDQLHIWQVRAELLSWPSHIVFTSSRSIRRQIKYFQVSQEMVFFIFFNDVWFIIRPHCCWFGIFSDGEDVVHKPHIMAWSTLAEPLLHDIDYEDGHLIVQKTGYYFVYTKVFFRNSEAFHHSIIRRTAKYNADITLLQSRTYSKSHDHISRSNSYLGGVFYLEKDDSICVNVSSTGKIVRHASYENVFGTYMI